MNPIPSIQLGCGHVLHLNCCLRVLEANWLGLRITFGFTNSNLQGSQNRRVAAATVDPLCTSTVVAEGARFHNVQAGFAMERYAYYVCFKCDKAYFGGEARCDMNDSDSYNRKELVCGGCRVVSQAQMYPKHGTDYLECKCRYCSSVTVFFCFGTTHFCNACHDDFQRVANIPVASKALPVVCDERS